MKQAPALLLVVWKKFYETSACDRRVYDIGLILQSLAVMVTSSYQSEIFSSGT